MRETCRWGHQTSGAHHQLLTEIELDPVVQASSLLFASLAVDLTDKDVLEATACTPGFTAAVRVEPEAEEVLDEFLLAFRRLACSQQVLRRSKEVMTENNACFSEILFKKRFVRCSACM